jgi:hypothetical protein
MWQTILVLFVLLGVSIYLVRHYVRVYRGEGSICAGCSGCCQNTAAETLDPDSRNAMDNSPSCEDMKKHENEVCH